MRGLILLLACLSVLICIVNSSGISLGTVYISESSSAVNPYPKVVYINGTADNSKGTAYGQFNDAEQQSGWGVLDILTNANTGKDIDIMYAAGYLEGRLTYEVIPYGWINMLNEWFPNNKVTPQVSKFVSDHDTWIRAQVAAHASTDDFWREISLILAQLDGLIAGYNAGPNTLTLNSEAFWLLNMDGDLEDVIPAVDPSLANYRLLYRLHRHSHCSGLIKLTDNDLFTSHDTWDFFASMVRIYKHYNIQLSVAPARRVSFSSSPGFLSSVDDFYITQNQLVVLETTNGFFNQSLFAEIKPQTALSWERCIVANTLATTGQEWTQIFSLFNSGTYNNQWMIVDYKLYTAGLTTLQANTLWIIETLPNYIRSADVTNVINTNGYWASYNIPYFRDIYYMSGFNEQYQENGNSFSYSQCPRALIFHRDQHNVVDLNSMKYLMTYNNYKIDPLSLGDPSNAIMARADLEPISKNSNHLFVKQAIKNKNLHISKDEYEYNPFLKRIINPDDSSVAAFGGIDNKITSSNMVPDYSAIAMNGPTHTIQPPFQWTSQFSSPHVGQPNLFNFQHLMMTPIARPSFSRPQIVTQ